MKLRGRATTLDEALACMNERYEYERGDENAVGNFVMDALSDKGERVRLGELLGYANDDVGTHQDAKDSAADGAGTVAETAAATAVVVGSGGTATALGGGFGALGSLTGGGVFSRESTDLAGKMIDNLPPSNTGGRRAVDEYSFKDTGYTTVQIEQMRQALLDRADIGRMQKSLQAVGVKVDRDWLWHDLTPSGTASGDPRWAPAGDPGS
jgi:hypothetical protein